MKKMRPKWFCIAVDDGYTVRIKDDLTPEQKAQRMSPPLYVEFHFVRFRFPFLQCQPLDKADIR